MAESGGLLNRYTSKTGYRGFESPSLRQSSKIPNRIKVETRFSPV